MNIFFLDKDPGVCALWMVDKHVTKMIVESAQIMSTVHRTADNCRDYPNLLKVTHTNHPCTKWARRAPGNYFWLARHALALSQEYTYRYDKVHKYESNGLLVWLLNNNPIGIDTLDFTKPAAAMPDEYDSYIESIPDECEEGTNYVIELYKHYYANKKSHIHSWKIREKPHWINQYKDAEIPIYKPE